MKITVFADPVCTWCWGSVPILGALKFRLEDSVDVEYVMGGMIEDISKFSNRRLGIGGDIPLSNRNMFKAWSEASAVHGMPVCTGAFHLFSEKHRSTFPQNLAYIAAKVYKDRVDENLCPNAFLRRLQEATAVDAALTCDAAVIADIAAVLGYQPKRFIEIMESREVRNLFEDGRAKARHYDIQQFPSYLLEYKGVEMVLRGFVSFETIVQNIKQFTYGKIDVIDEKRFEPTCDNVACFIEKRGSVYPVEIATAFSLPRLGGKSALNIESYEGLPDVMDELVTSGRVVMHPRGNGFILYKKNHKELKSFAVDAKMVEM